VRTGVRKSRHTIELVGAVALVIKNPPKVLLSDKLWRIKFPDNDSEILPEYALLALRQPAIRKIIGGWATGSSGSMQNISMEKAAKVLIPEPPLEKPKRMAEIARKCDRIRTQAKTQKNHI
jgi:type I restriction enzyme, S subunit